ncbi:MAG: O-antigen ligase family protein [Clostridia bacterium]|nr:O-antigen ligase family protein [Clostridia bacterium]
MAEIEKRNNRPVVLIVLQHILESRYLLFVSAVVVCALYYLAWDIVSIYYFGIIVILMLFFLKDLTPMIPHVAMMAIMTSFQNAPSELATGSNYYASVVIDVFLGIIAIIFGAALIFRFVMIGRDRTFKPNGIFWGLVALSAAFMLSGLGTSGYTWLNVGYGAVLSACFLAIYVLFAGSIEVSEKNFITLCWGFLALSVVLVIEECVKYIQLWPEVQQFLSGEIVYDTFKEYMVYGWGVWNTIGLMFNLCIPAVFLLSSKYRHGWILVIYATVLAGMTILTCSRQAYMGLIVTYPLPAIVAMVKGKRWKASLAVVCAVVLAVIIACLCKLSAVKEAVNQLLNSLFSSDGSYTGNGRFHLIMEAMNHFIENPFFGAGWYMGVADNSDTMINVSLIPSFACDTFAELLGACGMVGLIIYCVHRFQTILEFLKKPSADKLIMAMIILVILVESLVDSHIFYLMPTIIYAGLLPFVCTDKEEKRLMASSVLPAEIQSADKYGADSRA